MPIQADFNIGYECVTDCGEPEPCFGNVMVGVTAFNLIEFPDAIAFKIMVNEFLFSSPIITPSNVNQNFSFLVETVGCVPEYEVRLYIANSEEDFPEDPSQTQSVSTMPCCDPDVAVDVFCSPPS